jgi:altronate dehydratase large subunit
MQTTPRPTGNSHIAAVLVVGLESVTTQQVADGIAKSGKPVAMISVQDAGGTIEALAQGMRLLLPLVQDASAIRPERVPLSELILGVECGGTDTTSGIASNPALGWVADRVVDAGGAVYLSETSEWTSSPSASCCDRVVAKLTPYLRAAKPPPRTGNH